MMPLQSSESSENELTVSWTDEETEAVGAELEKLFALQDKPLKPEKRAMLIDEMSRYPLPVVAFIAGIRSLMTEELTRIKFSTIVAASRDMIDQPTAGVVVDCVHCGKTGAVTLEDDLHRSYSFACTCKNGDRLARGREALSRWNGVYVQYSGGRRLEMPQRFQLKIAPETRTEDETVPF